MLVLDDEQTLSRVNTFFFIIRDDWNRIRRETKVLTNLDHPNIINLFEVFQTEHALCIVTDYAEGGDLFDLITKNPQKKLPVIRN